MTATIVKVLPAARIGAKLIARLRALQSCRRLHSLCARTIGAEVVVLAGRVHRVHAVPLSVARELVPAIVRCSQRFSAFEVDESLFDDLIKVLSLGLGVSPGAIERLSVSLWEVAPVIGAIAKANGLPMVEAGSADMGKFLAAMAATETSIGMPSMPPSSAGLAGAGTTSTVH